VAKQRKNKKQKKQRNKGDDSLLEKEKEHKKKQWMSLQEWDNCEGEFRLFFLHFVQFYATRSSCTFCRFYLCCPIDETVWSQTSEWLPINR